MSKKNILITGASDGIGYALAQQMAKRGYDLALCARRIERLEQLKSEIRQQVPGCQVEIAALDVTHTAEVWPVIQSLQQKLGKLDIVVVNAGIARAGKLGQSDLQCHLDVINTNVQGAIATVDAALRVFREQGHGHLVATSSVAAFRGMPRNAAYSASKAALSCFMEGVRAETVNENIEVTVLHPGFIDTAINRDLPSRPFVIDVEKGARIFADRIEAKSKRACVPGWPWSLLGPVLKVLPTAAIAKM
ncbi:MAG: SDR family oxidoreductase [Oleiphilaceae bacterium]|nr:SDR family oxidoreductase [Oleiphilaceae bacterium]